MDMPNTCGCSSNYCDFFSEECTCRSEENTHEQTPYPSIVTRDSAVTHPHDPRLRNPYFFEPTTPPEADALASEMFWPYSERQWRRMMGLEPLDDDRINEPDDARVNQPNDARVNQPDDDRINEPDDDRINESDAEGTDKDGTPIDCLDPRLRSVAAPSHAPETTLPKPQLIASDPETSAVPVLPIASKPVSSAKGSSKSGIGVKRKPLADAPPDTARLPACPMGAVELMTFCPKHYLRPEIGHRLRGAGHHAQQVAFVQLHARGKLDGNLNKAERDQAFKSQRATLRHQENRNSKILHGCRPSEFYPTFQPPANPTYIVDQAPLRQGKVRRSENATATSLVELAKGVVNWPSGEDRGICTRVIEHAVTNNLVDLTTDDIPTVAQKQNFWLPAEASTDLWDQNAAKRVQQAIADQGL